MKKKLLLLMCALLAGISGAWADVTWTDVTSTYIQNANLSYTDDNPANWTITNLQSKANKDGKYAVEFYSDWKETTDRVTLANNSKESVAITQSVTLPAGTYKLVVNAWYRDCEKYERNLAAYLFAGQNNCLITNLSSGQSLDVDEVAKDDYKTELVFKVREDNTTFNIGVDATFHYYLEWIVVGGFKLYSTNDAVSNYYCSDYISNNDFETNADNWTNLTGDGKTSVGYTDNKNFLALAGTGFAEQWWGSGTFDFNQTLSNLPAGKYTLKAAARHETTDKKAYLYAGDKETEVTNDVAIYTIQDIEVLDGSLKIGYKGEKNAQVWDAVDNFQLIYQDEILPYDVTSAIQGADCTSNDKWPGSGRATATVTAYNGNSQTVFGSNSWTEPATKGGQRSQEVTIPYAGTYKLRTYVQVPRKNEQNNDNTNGFVVIWVDDLGNKVDYQSALKAYKVDTDGNNTDELNSDGSAWVANDIYFTANANDKKTIYINISDGLQTHTSLAYVSGMKLTYLGATPSIVLNENVINPAINVSSANVTIARSLNSDRWNTFCVPFAMTADEITSQFGSESKVKALSGVTYNNDNYSLKFSDASSIVAGKAYMVKPGTDVSEVSANGVAVNTAAESSSEVSDETNSNYKANFVGNINYLTKVPYDSYIISNNKFYLVDSDIIQKGFRGYITTEAPASSSVKAATLSYTTDEAATAVQNVTFEGLEESGVMYDLSGRKLSAKPNKGMYIMNGHKYIVR